MSVRTRNTRITRITRSTIADRAASYVPQGDLTRPASPGQHATIAKLMRLHKVTSAAFLALQACDGSPVTFGEADRLIKLLAAGDPRGTVAPVKVTRPAPVAPVRVPASPVRIAPARVVAPAPAPAPVKVPARRTASPVVTMRADTREVIPTVPVVKPARRSTVVKRELVLDALLAASGDAATLLAAVRAVRKI